MIVGITIGLVVALVLIGLWPDLILGTTKIRERREKKAKAAKPAPMTSSEFEAFYGWGEVPERFLAEEADKIGNEYVRGELTQQELEDGLDDMTGITRMEGR